MAEKHISKNRLDLTGRVFECLTVIRLAGFKRHIPYWFCQCTCGNTTESSGYKLLDGITISCGHLGRYKANEARRTHGMANKRSEYNIWKLMKKRCEDVDNHAYPRYGGRGITVCERWRNDFAAFLSDMGPRPSLDYCLERIDNNAGYSAENCRWATYAEQNNNTRQNHYVMYKGMRMTLTQAAQAGGISQSALRHRIERGWPESKWFEKIEPISKGKPA